jgi:hypothetical protein
MKKKLLLPALVSILVTGFSQQGTVKLENEKLRIVWTKSNEGWKIGTIQVKQNGKTQNLASPSGEYTLLYAAEKPSDSASQIFKTTTGIAWPDPVYKYQINVWKESTSPVSLNTAGAAIHFYPSEAKTTGPNTIEFSADTEFGKLLSVWSFDPRFPGDIIVKQNFSSKKQGYYSIASPTLATVDEKELSWATVPGYFQGREIQKNMVLSYAYGQGLPPLPVVYRERCASTFSPILSTKNNLSFSVIPDPGLGRDPWALDKNTHQDWFLGISHMNRKAQLSPTMYYPVLGKQGSGLEANASLNYGFRFSILNGEWYKLLEHSVNDVYAFKKTLTLRKNEQSLVSRIEEMKKYLSDKQTSLWNIEEFNGMKIGGQSYLGGVVGSNKDAQKNSDYGAMWMLASISKDRYLNDSVLPYALNFKLAQQQTEDGFFKGAAMGQYYLARSKKFVEEWGEFVEPVSLTYYIMLDIGNILLFEPDNKALKQRLTYGADLLLRWQKPDGSWDVAYDRHTHKPLFTDLQDLRPTFYGLMVAYRILKDQKYLAAAKKGADWFIKNGVEKGNFIGVCGDARYAPDFATAQAAQALLDLYDLSSEKKYQQAAIQTARMYLTSIYTQPVASEKIKTVNGIQRKDWQISQSGLSFEHGGIIGSANGGGPILLCSHAGMFIRIFQLTGDSLFVEMARAAAIGRDAFVDKKTSVASYYWNAMNRGAGPYPHHAWWQIGWITDYLMAELQMRSNNKIVFPRGFVTPKVGPHESYGFAPGKIYGQEADLVMRDKLVECNNPNIEYITALSKDKKKIFLMLLNDIGEPGEAELKIDISKLGEKAVSVAGIRSLSSNEKIEGNNNLKIQLKGYGIQVMELQLQ